jgi:hypothetical protein
MEFVRPKGLPGGGPPGPPELASLHHAGHAVVQAGAVPAAGIGLALRNLAPKSRPIGERYIGNYIKH